MNSRLTHIYAPNPGGVADYVNVCLANDLGASKFALSKKVGIDIPLPERSLLHYSGYGFAKRGAPLWLIEKLKNERSRIKSLGVFFHELYAFGPPWGSAFWLSPVQRHITRQLAEMSDYWITNREDSALWLNRFAGAKPHAVLPVFSNVGEMPAYSSERGPKIVVFGSAVLRLETYRTVGENLFTWAKEQGCEVHDIGAPISDPLVSEMLLRWNVVQHGRLDAIKVSRQLANASFGLLAYPLNYVAKSGVFAAYCAHGVCPILFSKGRLPKDGLSLGTHFLAGFPSEPMQIHRVQNMGSAAWNWYQIHRVAAHIDTTNQLLREFETIC